MLDRQFSINLNHFTEELSKIFNSYSLTEQGNGKIGIQSFLKFIKEYGLVAKETTKLALDMPSIEIIYKQFSSKNFKVNFEQFLIVLR